jgi:membrane associated rhomboid family serine protease
MIEIMKIPKILHRPPVTLLIVKINILVFIFWMSGIIFNQQFMIDHFLVSWDGLRDGRIWTLVTSAFSHNMLFHLFINMYAFFGFGTVVENELGSLRFLWFYLAAAIVASLAHCVVSAFLLGGPDLPALGASGAISGTILLFSLLNPRERILLLGLIPLPALLAALIFVGLDLWGLIYQTHGRGLPIGHGAHLGGAFYGLIYYFILRSRGETE